MLMVCSGDRAVYSCELSIHHSRPAWLLKRRGRLLRPLEACSLRARHLRPRRQRRWLRRLLLLLAQRIEYATTLPRRRGGRLLRRAGGILDDGVWLAVPVGQHREDQAGGKEGRREDRRRAGQHVGGFATRQKPPGRADTKPAPFRLLQEHDADHGGNHHQMNHDNHGLHASTIVAVLAISRATPASYRNSAGYLHDPPRRFHWTGG